MPNPNGLPIGTGNSSNLRQPRLAELHEDEIQREHQGGPEQRVHHPSLMSDGHTGYLYYFDAPRGNAGSANGLPLAAPSAMFYAPTDRSESAQPEGDAPMSAHLFPAYMRCRTERDIPESFLTVAGAVLAALIILIALAVTVVACGAAAPS
jgi:hypothetical protein